MKYLFLYFIIPMIVAFLVQNLLCRRVKKGILRHGVLILPMISIVVGIYTLLTQTGGVFGGLGGLAAVLWFANTCCTVFGYGVAWFVFLITRKGKDRA